MSDQLNMPFEDRVDGGGMWQKPMTVLAGGWLHSGRFALPKRRWMLAGRKIVRPRLLEIMSRCRGPLDTKLLFHQRRFTPPPPSPPNCSNRDNEYQLNREDVADVLVRCLGTPEATGKTFEVQSLPGLEKVIPEAGPQ